MKLTYHDTVDFMPSIRRVKGVFSTSTGDIVLDYEATRREMVQDPPTSRLSCFDVGPQQEGLGNVLACHQGSSVCHDSISGELDKLRRMARS
jgi:hypothetical protein